MITPAGRLPLTIFCGKGGVGKTTLSLAYALGHANRGKTALLVTSHPLGELAVSVSLAGLKQKCPEAAANLFVIHIDPKEILNHTVRRQIPSELLADAVISSRIYQSLIEVAPGLKEMVFLGRLQQLAEERTTDASSNKFNLVIWDAPATGHFLQTLQVSRHFDLYLSGPFAALGKQLTKFFSDRSNFALFPVATLEEMAVEETIELAGELSELSMHPRSLVCNMASPLLAAPEAERESVYRQTSPEQPELEFIRHRLAVERSLFQQLGAATETKLRVVERASRRETDLDLLLDLSRRLEALGEL